MKQQQVATSGLVLRQDKKFLLVRRSAEEDFMPGVWELPGGGAEYGESPEQALERELKEECGLDVIMHNPLTVGQYYMGDVHRTEITFVCTLKDQNQKVQLSPEHDTFVWVPVEELDHYDIDDYMRQVLNKATADLNYWINKYFKE